MKKIVLLCGMVLGLAVSGFAQKGLHLGGNAIVHTNWLLNPQNWDQEAPALDYQQSYGWQLGAVIGANFTKSFGIHTGVTMARFKHNFEGEQDGTAFERAMDFEMLLVPAFLRFSPGKKHRFYFQAGPQFGFIRRVKQDYSPEVEDYHKVNDVTDRYRKTNVDLVVELGPDFRLVPNLYMNIGIRGAVGLMDINGEEYQIPNSEGDYEISRPARIGLSIGLRYVVFGRK